MSSPERNERRADRAEHALEAYFSFEQEQQDCDDYANIADLITDLLHLARRKTVQPPASVTDAAIRNFEAELDHSDTNDE